MIVHIAAPWTATLSQPQYMLVQYFLVLAALVLFAGFVRTWLTRDEVGARYRSAVVARLGVMGVATLSYLMIVLHFQLGYDQTPLGQVPNDLAINTVALRYVDWSVTVPLLTIELLAVTTLTGAALRRIRILAVSGAFLMIFLGYLGAIVIGGGESRTQLLLWGTLSSAFWAGTTVVLITAVRRSQPGLTPEAGRLLRYATAVLLTGWVIYPLVFLTQVFGSGPAWTTTTHIAFSVADICVKVLFCGLVHRIAKLRTAEDVRSGDDVHGEAIWISSVKQSDAGQPDVVFLADGAAVHRSREAPARNQATPYSADAMPGYVDQ